MSNSSHKSDIVVLSVLGILTVLAIGVMLGWGLRGGDEERRLTLRTSHSTNVEGTAVYYALLERLGFVTTRFEQPLSAETLAGVDALFLLNPVMPFQDDELLALDRWVRDGGVVICAGTARKALAFLHETGTSSDLGAATGGGGSSPPPTASGTSGSSPPSVLASDVSRTTFETPHALVADGNTPSEDASEFDSLFADAGGTRIAARRVEKGWVIVLADSSFLANGRIGEADNMILASNLAAFARWRAKGGRIAFDEYHFGYGAHETGWQAIGFLLLHTGPGWSVLSLMVAGVLWLIYKGRRFGTRRGIEKTRRRSKLEYVHSVGATYRAAGAGALVLEQILTHVRRRVAELFGISPNAGVEEIARRLSTRTGNPRDHYVSVLQKCDQALATGHVSARRLSALLDRLAHVEKELLDEHFRGK